MSIETIMGWAAILFGVLGSIASVQQAYKIWSSRSAQSVSGVWTITFLAMFTAFLTYGTQQGSFPMQFQGWLRVAFTLPITLGFVAYGKDRGKKHVMLALGYTALLSAMSIKVASPLLFTLFSFLGVTASFIQAYTIRKERTRGKVAVELQIIYLAAILCWLVYGLSRKDVPLILVAIGFTLSYSSTIIMWKKYP